MNFQTSAQHLLLVDRLQRHFHHFAANCHFHSLLCCASSPNPILAYASMLFGPIGAKLWRFRRNQYDARDWTWPTVECILPTLVHATQRTAQLFHTDCTLFKFPTDHQSAHLPKCDAHSRSKISVHFGWTDRRKHFICGRFMPFLQFPWDCLLLAGLGQAQVGYSQKYQCRKWTNAISQLQFEFPILQLLAAVSQFSSH